ncbi:porin [Escherichia coli]
MVVTWARCMTWKPGPICSPEFGGDSSAQTDNFMTKRASGLATYRNTDFFRCIDGLNLTLQYQGKNENRDVKKQNGDGFRHVIDI